MLGWRMIESPTSPRLRASARTKWITHGSSGGMNFLEAPKARGTIRVDPFAPGWVFQRSMSGQWVWSSSGDCALDFPPRRRNSVGRDRVAGRDASGLPRRTGCQGDSPELRFHRPRLPCPGAKPFRSLRLRSQRRHAPRPILTHGKAPSGFAKRPFPCLTHWLSREGLTGFTKNRDTFYAMRDVEYQVGLSIMKCHALVTDTVERRG